MNFVSQSITKLSAKLCVTLCYKKNNNYNFIS